MAQHSNDNNSASQQLVKPVFHDFLGSKPNDSHFVLEPKTANVRLSEASPSSASMSIAASSSGGRGPFSTTSDIGSERKVGNHLEGVPFYGPRSDFSDTGLSNRLIGNKRSSSDSAFMGSSRDAFQMVPDSIQNSHLMKMFRSTAGGEHHRRSNDDEVFLGTQSQKPTSASQIFQPLTGTKLDANRWERSVIMNVGPSMHHPPHGAPLTPVVHQIASNKVRDANIGPSFISQSAADEGSRTGMKGPGILSSINITTAATEKTPSAMVLGGGRPKRVMNIIDLESSTPTSQNELRSASCQMTIFYGGRAHVFDNVHPNKADVIMSLAGSNGGSWSTSTCSPKPPLKLLHDTSHTETGKLHAIPSADRITTPPSDLKEVLLLGKMLETQSK
ncbi:protein TIFY 8-like isoform X2 [Prosopis cineraria]|uniref:protein TIFY 8-like isoform X2 n=1 Tax=Prosopis cineraria TaxID=364024 RepID=UPI00240EBD99|nr:protein TIFY 8-like isoform X2 [Prosopis cineraria]